MRNLWQEFKAFAFKGNMIDMAVGIIIGAAFSGVIKSLVDDVFMPLLGIIGGGGDGYLGLSFIINGSTIYYGRFMGAIIQFLIIAAAIFLVIVKILGALVKKVEPEPAPEEPTMKECEYCLSEIPLNAARCRYCTSELPAAALA